MAAASATLPSSTFLSAFGLSAESLSTFLHDVNGMIAGGAALYWYLGRESPADQDLDIWIPTKTKHNPDYSSLATDDRSNYKSLPLTTLPDGTPDPVCYEYDNTLHQRTKDFLASAGYKWFEHGSAHRWGWECADRRNTRVSPPDIPYHNNPAFQRIIRSINDYYPADAPVQTSLIGTYPPTGVRKIQVIFYYGDADPLANFDLDICRIAAIPEPTSIAHFRFQLPADTTPADLHASRMRVINDNCPDNLCRRVCKYYKRGFHMVGTINNVIRPLTIEEAALYCDIR